MLESPEHSAVAHRIAQLDPSLRLAALRQYLTTVDPAQKPLVEDLLLLASLSPPKVEKPRVVVLVHGIRTHAEWQDKLYHEITKNTDVLVYPIGYGYLDVVRFLSPVITRSAPINRVVRELRTISSRHPNADISIVAHSFGTYIISQILEEHTDLKFHRIQLCGSIISSHYRWDKVASRVTGAIVNDAGTRDVWPVLAKSASWGYGPTGTFGFKTASVRDRYYDCGHSDFFEVKHMRKFWLPLLLDGQIVPSQWTVTRPKVKAAMNVLNLFPAKTLVAAGIAAFSYFKFF